MVVRLRMRTSSQIVGNYWRENVLPLFISLWISYQQSRRSFEFFINSQPPATNHITVGRLWFHLMELVFALSEERDPLLGAWLRSVFLTLLRTWESVEVTLSRLNSPLCWISQIMKHVKIVKSVTGQDVIPRMRVSHVHFNMLSRNLNSRIEKLPRLEF